MLIKGIFILSHSFQYLLNQEIKIKKKCPIKYKIKKVKILPSLELCANFDGTSVIILIVAYPSRKHLLFPK